MTSDPSPVTVDFLTGSSTRQTGAPGLRYDHCVHGPELATFQGEESDNLKEVEK